MFVFLTISLFLTSTIAQSENLKNTKIDEEDIILEIIQEIDSDMMLSYIQDLVTIANKHDVKRLTGTEGCEEAREYILSEFMELGISTNIHDWAELGLIIPYKHLLFVSENVEGVIPGKQGSYQSIVLMAHYDTTALTPSADDNSAGVAAVLSAAKVLSQYEFNHEIRFLLVSGEEEGLLGSAAYAENAYSTCDNIKAVINLDMIGYSDPEIEEDEYKVRCYETCSNVITNKVIDVCNNIEYSPYFNFEVISSSDDAGHVSDQRSFCNYGYDAAFLHEFTWNENKDRGTDTIENMDYEYATRVARLAAAVIADYGLEEITENRPPNPPAYVDGEKTIQIGEEQIFTTEGSDPDGDEIYFMFDWGDGTHSEWLGPYDAEDICQASHIWNEPGEYKIKAKAKDSIGFQSAWSSKDKTKNLINNIFRNIIQKFPILKLLLDKLIFL